MDRALRLKPNLRRSLPAIAAALLAFIVSQQFEGLHGHAAGVGVSLFGWHLTIGAGWITLAVIGVTVLFVVAGVVATRSIARELDRVSRDRAGVAAGSAIRLVCLIVGYLIVGLGALSILQVNLGNLLVGGAVTGVILGIAAQPTLSNFFAGLILLFSRPYVPGRRIKIHTGAMGGPFEGEIIATGLMYTTISTASGPIVLPNSGLLGAAIESPTDEPDEPDEDVEDKFAPAPDTAGSEQSDGPDGAGPTGVGGCAAVPNVAATVADTGSDHDSPGSQDRPWRAT